MSAALISLGFIRCDTDAAINVVRACFQARLGLLGPSANTTAPDGLQASPVNSKASCLLGTGAFHGDVCFLNLRARRCKALQARTRH